LITRYEILEFSRAYRLDANIVEKDYVIGWVLGGISQIPEFADTWAFKGGTCLKKCFLETYRFSEDLDFTLENPEHLRADSLTEAFTRVAQWVYDRSGIEIPKERIRFDVYEGARGKPAAEGRLYYLGPMGRQGDPPRIKLDLTIDEIVVLEPERREVFHPYSDKPDPSLFSRCYPLVELFSEKMRALAERLRPRDLYDVVFLSRLDGLRIESSLLREILEKKCAYKGLAVPTLASLESNPGRAELEAEWANMLGHQLPFLPAFAEYWADLPRIFGIISGAPAESPRAGISVGIEIDETWRPPRQAADITPSNWLETIRIAAVNRLCVNLRYAGTQRLIEPYSLRRTKRGDILLYGVKHKTGDIRAYRLDRIEGAEATRIPFVPKFAIELTTYSRDFSSSGRTAFRRPISTLSMRRLSRAPRRPIRAITVGLGPRYIFRCLICDRKFTKKTNDPTLNRHKDKYGMECSGRTGYLEEVKSA